MFICLTLLQLVSCSREKKQVTTTGTADTMLVGKTNAPEFPLYTDWLNTGRPYKLSDFRGRIVLLDFWTYACINCIHILPDLKKLEREFPGLVVVGVHSAKFEGEKSTENIKNAILKYDIEHPVINDHKFELWKQYAVRAWPTLVLIDPEGKVVSSSSGEGVYKRLQPVIAKMSEEFAKRGVLKTEPFGFKLVKFNESRSLLSFPSKLAADEKGKRLFISDSNNDRILVISPQGEVLEVIGSGVAGNADGDFGTARFYRPQGLAYDEVKDVLYIADTENHLVRKAELKTKKVSTLLGNGTQANRMVSSGKGNNISINSPWDIALKGTDGIVIAMAGHHQLWKLDVNTLQAEAIAGTGGENIVDGPSLQAKLAQPSGITSDGKVFYFADSEVSALRKLENDSVKTLIGEGLFEFGDVDGTYPEARLQHPLGVHYHDELIYIADTYNNKIKTFDTRTRELKTLAGTGRTGMADGPFSTAGLNEPNDIVYLDGRFYITDTNNGLIRYFDLKKRRLQTLQISNMKMLKPKIAEQEFSGKKVELPAVSIAPGKGSLELNLLFRPGFEFNKEAPNYFVVKTSDGKVIQTLSYDENVAALPFKIPVDAVIGSTTISIEAEIYYCEHAMNARCFVDRILFLVPVEVKNGAPTILKLEYSY
jgi:thiol-disulfide isomerase/thioredoxin